MLCLWALLVAVVPLVCARASLCDAHEAGTGLLQFAVGRDEMVEMPFDPSHDGMMVYSEPKTGSGSLEWSAGLMLEPPCRVRHARGTRAIMCHAESCATDFLNSRPSGSRTWILSSNRNPFEMRPSALFQEIYGHWTADDIRTANMSALSDTFHTKYGKSSPRWWTKHFYDTFGLNITAQPFDFEKKLLHVEHVWNSRQLSVIALRLEDSRQWNEILRPFFPKMRLVKANQMAAKGSTLASKYREFLGALRWTDTELDFNSRTESFTHFYTLEEQRAFLGAARGRGSPAARMAAGHADNLDEVFEDPAALPTC